MSSLTNKLLSSKHDGNQYLKIWNYKNDCVKYFYYLSFENVMKKGQDSLSLSVLGERK